MEKPTKIQLYEEALINIWKLGGKCWDGERVCGDPQAVADMVLKECNPTLHKLLSELEYKHFDATKDGRVITKKTKL